MNSRELKLSAFIRKTTAAFALTVFFITNHFPVSAFAAPSQNVSIPAPPKDITANLKSVELPKDFGKVEDFFQGDPGRTVIIIQDAHEIPDAQKNIFRIIRYFQKEYGVTMVGLEGADSSLDSRIFRSFPDQKELKKAFGDYFNQGELTGGSAAAIFSDFQSEYHGVENWDLFEMGLGLYLASMKHEPELREKVEAWKKDLDSRKEKAYPKNLLDIDRKWTAFQNDEGDLTSVLKLLAAVKRPENSEILAVVEEIGKEGQTNPNVELEVKQLAEKIKRFLSYQTTKKGTSKQGASESWKLLTLFNHKYQQFQTSTLSAQGFALFLKQLAVKYKIPVKVSQELLGGMKNQRTMKQMEGTRFFAELEKYVQSVKDSLMTSDEQRGIDRETADWQLAEKWMKLELSREDWEKVKTRPLNVKDRFGKDDFKIQTAFYKNAEERDRVFLENLEKTIGSRKQKEEKDAILVAGGFHAQGLQRRLKEKKISYLLVMPEIASIPKDTHYRDHMRGEISWKKYFTPENGKINLYKAFVRGTRDKLLATSDPEKPYNGNMLKNWRDQIIRDLADRKEIEKAGDYTKYLDEIIPGNEVSPLDAGVQNAMQKVERFIDGLRKLSDQNQLTDQNIQKLFNPATVPTFVNPTSAVGGENSKPMSDIAQLEALGEDALTGAVGAPEAVVEGVPEAVEETEGTVVRHELHDLSAKFVKLSDGALINTAPDNVKKNNSTERIVYYSTFMKTPAIREQLFQFLVNTMASIQPEEPLDRVKIVQRAFAELAQDRLADTKTIEFGTPEGKAVMELMSRMRDFVENFFPDQYYKNPAADRGNFNNTTLDHMFFVWISEALTGDGPQDSNKPLTQVLKEADEQGILGARPEIRSENRDLVLEGLDIKKNGTTAFRVTAGNTAFEIQVKINNDGTAEPRIGKVSDGARYVMTNLGNGEYEFSGFEGKVNEGEKPFQVFQGNPLRFKLEASNLAAGPKLVVTPLSGYELQKGPSKAVTQQLNTEWQDNQIVLSVAGNKNPANIKIQKQPDGKFTASVEYPFDGGLQTHQVYINADGEVSYSTFGDDFNNSFGPGSLEFQIVPEGNGLKILNKSPYVFSSSAAPQAQPAVSQQPIILEGLDIKKDGTASFRVIPGGTTNEKFEIKVQIKDDGTAEARIGKVSDGARYVMTNLGNGNFEFAGFDSALNAGYKPFQVFKDNALRFNLSVLNQNGKRQVAVTPQSNHEFTKTPSKAVTQNLQLPWKDGQIVLAVKDPNRPDALPVNVVLEKQSGKITAAVEYVSPGITQRHNDVYISRDGEIQYSTYGDDFNPYKGTGRLEFQIVETESGLEIFNKSPYKFSAVVRSENRPEVPLTPEEAMKTIPGEFYDAFLGSNPEIPKKVLSGGAKERRGYFNREGHRLDVKVATADGKTNVQVGVNSGTKQAPSVKVFVARDLQTGQDFNQGQFTNDLRNKITYEAQNAFGKVNREQRKATKAETNKAAALAALEELKEQIRKIDNDYPNQEKRSLMRTDLYAILDATNLSKETKIEALIREQDKIREDLERSGLPEITQVFDDFIAAATGTPKTAAQPAAASAAAPQRKETSRQRAVRKGYPYFKIGGSGDPEEMTVKINEAWKKTDLEAQLKDAGVKPGQDVNVYLIDGNLLITAMVGETQRNIEVHFREGGIPVVKTDPYRNRKNARGSLDGDLAKNAGRVLNPKGLPGLFRDKYGVDVRKGDHSVTRTAGVENHTVKYTENGRTYEVVIRLTEVAATATGPNILTYQRSPSDPPKKYYVSQVVNRAEAFNNSRDVLDRLLENPGTSNRELSDAMNAFEAEAQTLLAYMNGEGFLKIRTDEGRARNGRQMAKVKAQVALRQAAFKFTAKILSDEQIGPDIPFVNEGPTTFATNQDRDQFQDAVAKAPSNEINNFSKVTKSLGQRFIALQSLRNAEAAARAEMYNGRLKNFIEAMNSTTATRQTLRDAWSDYQVYAQSYQAYANQNDLAGESIRVGEDLKRAAQQFEAVEASLDARLTRQEGERLAAEKAAREETERRQKEEAENFTRYQKAREAVAASIDAGEVPGFLDIAQFDGAYSRLTPGQTAQMQGDKTLAEDYQDLTQRHEALAKAAADRVAAKNKEAAAAKEQYENQRDEFVTTITDDTDQADKRTILRDAWGKFKADAQAYLDYVNANGLPGESVQIGKDLKAAEKAFNAAIDRLDKRFKDKLDKQIADQKAEEAARQKQEADNLGAYEDAQFDFEQQLQRAEKNPNAPIPSQDQLDRLETTFGALTPAQRAQKRGQTTLEGYHNELLRRNNDLFRQRLQEERESNAPINQQLENLQRLRASIASQIANNTLPDGADLDAYEDAAEAFTQFLETNNIEWQNSTDAQSQAIETEFDEFNDLMSRLDRLEENQRWAKDMRSGISGTPSDTGIDLGKPSFSDQNVEEIAAAVIFGIKLQDPLKMPTELFNDPRKFLNKTAEGTHNLDITIPEAGGTITVAVNGTVIIDKSPLSVNENFKQGPFTDNLRNMIVRKASRHAFKNQRITQSEEKKAGREDQSIPRGEILSMAVTEIVKGGQENFNPSAAAVAIRAEIRDLGMGKFAARFKKAAIDMLNSESYSSMATTDDVKAMIRDLARTIAGLKKDLSVAMNINPNMSDAELNDFIQALLQVDENLGRVFFAGATKKVDSYSKELRNAKINFTTIKNARDISKSSLTSQNVLGYVNQTEQTSDFTVAVKINGTEKLDAVAKIGAAFMQVTLALLAASELADPDDLKDEAKRNEFLNKLPASLRAVVTFGNQEISIEGALLQPLVAGYKSRKAAAKAA